MRLKCLVLLFAVFGFGTLAHADEGMWTFDNFPTAQMKAAYGWAPDKAWLDHARLSTLQLPEGCTASFVSAGGLMMTNHHCARDCVAAISDAKHDYVASGFYAAAFKDERKCAGMEADELIGIADVTSVIDAATKGKTGKAFADAQRAAMAKQEAGCAKSAALRCDVVSFYDGGKYALYTYKRFQDLRLVFAIEDDAANFGGDPDNFEFPRYDIDVAFMRVYDQGQPLHPLDHLSFAAVPAKPGDIVLTAGNPYSTDREDTVAQLIFQRDFFLPVQRTLASEQAGILWEMGRQSPELRRETLSDYFYTMNTLKALQGSQKALVEGPLMASKIADEAALRKQVDANPALSADKCAWDAIAQAQAKDGPMFLRYELLEDVPQGWIGDLMRQALELNRVATESVKPDGKRLEEYDDANMPSIAQDITSALPNYPAVDKTLVAWWLQDVVYYLGADDPAVKTILGKQSPDEIADQIIDATKLANPALRAKLLAGGAKAINASNDPLLVFMRRVNGPARAMRDDYDNNVKAVVTQNAALIAHARFALYGTSVYPDANFTPRVSYGTVKGYWQDGKFVSPLTNFAGAFARATGEEPFKLPPSWLKAENTMDTATSLDMVTTNDITGGNSGSPVINQNGQIVGLIFDGDIQSLGGDYGYDGTVNRAVSVDSTALKLALTRIYDTRRLAKELGME